MQFELAPGREAVYFDTARPLTSFLHVSEIIASTYMVWGFWGDRTFFWHAFSWLFVSALLVRMCRGAGPRSAAAAVLPRHFPPPLPPAPEAWQNAPAEFICPITRGLMLLPVITPLGTSYEWEALAGWIGANHRYPSGEGGELLLEMLAPNLALRQVGKIKAEHAQVEKTSRARSLKQVEHTSRAQKSRAQKCPAVQR